MNEIAKRAICDHLTKAISDEKITVSEAARLLGIKPIYASMIRNPNQWNKCSSIAWEIARQWTNSGESLKKFGEKKNHLKVKETIGGNKITEAVKEKVQDSDLDTKREYVNKMLEQGNVPERPDQDPDPQIDNRGRLDTGFKTIPHRLPTGCKPISGMGRSLYRLLPYIENGVLMWKGRGSRLFGCGDILSKIGDETRVLSGDNKEQLIKEINHDSTVIYL